MGSAGLLRGSPASGTCLELRGKRHAQGFEPGACIPGTDLSSSAALKRGCLMAKLLPSWPFGGWHLSPFPSCTPNCLDWPPLAEWVSDIAEQGGAGDGSRLCSSISAYTSCSEGLLCLLNTMAFMKNAA